MLIVAGLTSCNTYNDKMNALLQNKSELEKQIKTNSLQADLFGSEMKLIGATEYKKRNYNISKYPKSYWRAFDSSMKYAHIADDIRNNELRAVRYSIDSLSRLK